MKRLIGLLFMVLACASLVADSSAAKATEAQHLRYDNIMLRRALAEAQIQIVQAKIDADWQALEKDVRATLGAKPDDEIDWSMLTIKRPEPAKPASVPK